jgi:hypothetical protein
MRKLALPLVVALAVAAAAAASTLLTPLAFASVLP